MRIYIDNCVIQDLKKPDFSNLLDLIRFDQKNNIYCYSEAHLQDFMRDKSQEKFNDLKFMESIVKSNCWYFNKKIFFDHILPSDFYKPFPEFREKIFEKDEIFSKDSFIGELFESLKHIPFDLSSMIDIESLPIDFPKQFKILLENTTNFYDFFCNFGNITNELATNQKDFKELIVHLHKCNLSSLFFEHIGIVGYNGRFLTDIDKFRESYNSFLSKDKKKKNIYEQFLNQYNGLEFFGIVKGVPRKQKMMNMINDGRHAFFGGYCDIVVSKDIDFIEKSKFMYEIHDISTLIFNMNEFQNFLDVNISNSKLSLVDMIEDGNIINTDNIIQNENGIFSMLLDKTYYSYFNNVNYISNEKVNYTYYTRAWHNLSPLTLKCELEIIVDAFIDLFGIDLNGKKEFLMEEITENKWEGRIWINKSTQIILNFNKKIYLAIFPIQNI